MSQLKNIKPDSYAQPERKRYNITFSREEGWIMILEVDVGEGCEMQPTGPHFSRITSRGGVEIKPFSEQELAHWLMRQYTTSTCFVFEAKRVSDSYMPDVPPGPIAFSGKVASHE